MIYAFDTFYQENTAKTACIGFEDWPSNEILFSKIMIRCIDEDYISGQFYKRELPCILEFMDDLQIAENDIIVIDGYVLLDDHGKLGLGGYLFEHIGGKNPVIGVAKSNFQTIVHQKKEILRGSSTKPLYVSAMGINLEFASECIKQMAGDFRIPDLLKKLDMLTKAREQA